MIEKFPRARFGIEIRGVSTHVEAEELTDVGNLLHGHAGRVHIIDRLDRSLLMAGSVEEVRHQVETLVGLPEYRVSSANE